MKTLPVPEFYKPHSAFEPAFHPTIAAPSNNPTAKGLMDWATEWRQEHGIPPAWKDEINILVVLIDYQYDFASRFGTLFVAGKSGIEAEKDSARLSEWLYRNLQNIHQIIASLDSHPLTMISHPNFLVNRNGEHPSPFTELDEDSFRSGEWGVNPAIVPFLPLPGWIADTKKYLNEYLPYYVTELKKGGRGKLIVWPEHGTIGSYGHRLVGVVDEAIRFHEYVRGSANLMIPKGQSPFTESYSVFRPDVMTFHDGRPIPGAVVNEQLDKPLLEADVVVWAGEAASHCLPWSVMDAFSRHPELAAKSYLLEDAMSPVVTPYQDFTETAQTAMSRFQEMGAHIVKTTDPLESWPGMIQSLLQEFSTI